MLLFGDGSASERSDERIKCNLTSNAMLLDLLFEKYGVVFSDCVLAKFIHAKT